MRRRHTALAAAASLTALLPFARAAGGVRLPTLPLSDRRLTNGLRVVGLPMPDAGTVAVQV